MILGEFVSKTCCDTVLVLWVLCLVRNSDPLSQRMMTSLFGVVCMVDNSEAKLISFSVNDEDNEEDDEILEFLLSDAKIVLLGEMGATEMEAHDRELKDNVRAGDELKPCTRRRCRG